MKKPPPKAQPQRIRPQVQKPKIPLKPLEELMPELAAIEMLIVAEEDLTVYHGARINLEMGEGIDQATYIKLNDILNRYSVGQYR